MEFGLDQIQTDESATTLWRRNEFSICFLNKNAFRIEKQWNYLVRSSLSTSHNYVVYELLLGNDSSLESSNVAQRLKIFFWLRFKGLLHVMTETVVQVRQVYAYDGFVIAVLQSVFLHLIESFQG